ncbi:hypothetical protein EON65_41735 [archaeon]|nr:MAG: hypothetical protein EON65_41735 [archaeon]
MPPISLDEAIQAMEYIDHPFYVFRNKVGADFQICLLLFFKAMSLFYIRERVCGVSLPSSKCMLTYVLRYLANSYIYMCCRKMERSMWFTEGTKVEWE